MEREGFFRGYCRCIDGSRMVAAVAEGSTLTEADCAYADCPHAPDCPIGRKIWEFLEQE